MARARIIFRAKRQAKKNGNSFSVTATFQLAISTSSANVRSDPTTARPRSALRLRQSAEAPHGRATTTLRRGFVLVRAITVGGCGSRAEPSIRRARAGGKEKFGVVRR